EENVPPIGTAPHWARASITSIIKDRRAVGEYRPYKRVGKDKRVKDGAPIPNYYPAAVSETEWREAQQGKPGTRGRVSKHVSLFVRGLIRDARTGGTFLEATRTDNGKHYRVLLPTASNEGRGKCVSFPLPTFEAAILSRLQEIDP